jgi:hypothetical protein
VVSIPACHAGDPGSIPGNGVFFNSTVCVTVLWKVLSNQNIDTVLQDAKAKAPLQKNDNPSQIAIRHRKHLYLVMTSRA